MVFRLSLALTVGLSASAGLLLTAHHYAERGHMATPWLTIAISSAGMVAFLLAASYRDERRRQRAAARSR